MSRLVLHVGVPKTGSSAIQAFLCRHSQLNAAPNVDEGADNIRYAVSRDGHLIDGQSLKWQAALHPLNYLPSSDNLSAALAPLKPDIFSTSSILLSQESWSRSSQSLMDLPAIGVPIDIIMFVRPQAEWLQSAWWQWFAWTNRDGNPAHAWRVLRDESVLDWAYLAECFAQCPQVRNVSLRLFRPGTDVVANFLDAVGTKPPAGVRTAHFRRNATLTTHHLRIYRALPWLRPDNAGTIDAVLSCLWPFGSKPKTPITPLLADEIINACRLSNEKLLGLLPPEEAQSMRQDPRWWDASVYAA